MLHSATKRRTVIAGTIVAISPLMTARRVSAHENHYGVDHTEQTDSEATGEHSDSSSESAVTDGGTPSTADETGSEANIASPEQSNNTAAIQEVPAAQTAASTAEAGLFNGFSIGLGETLFALIIAGPFLLISTKRKMRS